MKKKNKTIKVKIADYRSSDNENRSDDTNAPLQNLVDSYIWTFISHGFGGEKIDFYTNEKKRNYIDECVELYTTLDRMYQSNLRFTIRQMKHHLTIMNDNMVATPENQDAADSAIRYISLCQELFNKIINEYPEMNNESHDIATLPSGLGLGYFSNQNELNNTNYPTSIEDLVTFQHDPIE